jgi:O-antigen/teichoic acid export membrane protein
MTIYLIIITLLTLIIDVLIFRNRNEILSKLCYEENTLYETKEEYLESVKYNTSINKLRLVYFVLKSLFIIIVLILERAFIINSFVSRTFDSDFIWMAYILIIFTPFILLWCSFRVLEKKQINKKSIIAIDFFLSILVIVLFALLIYIIETGFFLFLLVYPTILVLFLVSKISRSKDSHLNNMFKDYSKKQDYSSNIY